MIVAPGTTSLSVDVQFLDDTGAAVTGKVAADFPTCKWSGGSNTADTTITLSDLAAITTAHPNNNTAGGVKEREGGWYRLDIPNNAVSAAGCVTLTFAETTNKRIIAPLIDVQLPANFSALGITAGGKVSEVVLTDTLTTYTGNTLQTGDSFARIGANGAGLSAIPDLGGVTTLLSRIGGAITITTGGVLVHSVDTGGITAASFSAGAITATVAPNLDAAVSTRTKPADTQARVTLVDTTTALTNAPGAGDFTATMKTSLNAATPTVTAGTVSDKTGYALTADERTSIAATILAAISEGAETVVQTLRIIRAAVVGKLSGAPSGPIKVRDLADSKDRISVTIDPNNNRTSVTTDGS